ncbi:MAG: hypothetical protein DMF97_05385 [Acidobacteria bacterium]|nr:MAG: hypothetical protein DMF97_05385 [Acidobacteriota bacterium]
MPVTDRHPIFSRPRPILVDQEPIDQLNGGVFTHEPRLDGPVILVHGPRHDRGAARSGFLENCRHWHRFEAIISFVLTSARSR